MKGPFWLLRYSYVADVGKLRPSLRPAHLELATAFVKEKRMLLGGALDPLETKREGLLVFATEEDAKAFASRDPYVVANPEARVVESYRIDQWNVVVGSLLQ